MALIACAECHREITDQATVCPHCGRRRHRLGAAVLVGILTVVILYGLIH